MTAWRKSEGRRPRLLPLALMVAAVVALEGCHAFPVAATFQGNVNANVATESSLHGSLEVKMPSSVDPGPMVGTVVRAGRGSAPVRGSP